MTKLNLDRLAAALEAAGWTQDLVDKGAETGNLAEYRALLEGRAELDQIQRVVTIEKTGLTPDKLLSHVTEGGAKVDGYIHTLFSDSPLQIGARRKKVLQIISAERLGVAGWHENEFWGEKGFAHLNTRGFQFCEEDDAAYLRRATMDQLEGEIVLVGHQPFSAIRCHGDTVVFEIGHTENSGFYLKGHAVGKRTLRAEYLIAVEVVK